MGHTHVTDDNNALYGFKTDLREQLTNRNLPRWLNESPIHVKSKKRDISVDEAFEQAASLARERRRERDLDNPTYPIQFVFNRGSPHSDRDPVPDRIDEKLNITLDDGKRATDRNRPNPKEYRLEVDVGPRGGIDDLRVVRPFHH
jgi:hypothetical protein